MKLHFLIPSILALTVAGQAVAGTPVYRVGLACEYPTIQAALNAIPANGSGVLRIRAGNYSENVFVLNKNVEMIGGYANCTATEPTEHGLSAIDATGSSLPALRYLVGDNRELRLTSINLANGTGVSDPDDDPLNPYPGGGLSVWTNTGATATVILNRSAVFDNHSNHRGGGIALLGTGNGELQLRNNSRIFSNTVGGDQPRGGGLYCQGNYQIVMWGGSINNNVAGGAVKGFGGGIHLDGCAMGWLADQQTASTADDASLRNNTAHGDGGGIYAHGGAVVVLVGADDDTASAPSSRPLHVRANQALDDDELGTIGFGGAIYAEGHGTSITLDRTWIHENHANRIGGAIYARDGAVVNVVRATRNCHNSRKCSRIFNNSAADIGSVGYGHGEGTQINVVRTSMTDNTIVNSSGSPLYIADGAGLIVVDSLLAGNSSAHFSITLWNSGTGFGAPVHATIARSTIADTQPHIAVFRLVGDVTLQAQGSIIHESSLATMTSILGGSPTVNTQCMMWHNDDLTYLGSSEHTVVADPLFVKRESGSYYLQPESPAINFCSGPTPGPSQVDLDWNPRGLIHSGQPVQHGPYDLGAYEQPQVIFSDRFEQ